MAYFEAYPNPWEYLRDVSLLYDVFFFQFEKDAVAKTAVQVCCLGEVAWQEFRVLECGVRKGFGREEVSNSLSMGLKDRPQKPSETTAFRSILLW